MCEFSLNFVLGSYLSWHFPLVPPFFGGGGCERGRKRAQFSLIRDLDVVHRGYALVKPNPLDHRLICFIHLANNYSKILLIQLSWD